MTEFGFKITSNDTLLDKLKINAYYLESTSLELSLNIETAKELQYLLNLVLHQVVKNISITVLDGNTIISILDYNVDGAKIVSLSQTDKIPVINATLSFEGKFVFYTNR